MAQFTFEIAHKIELVFRVEITGDTKRTAEEQFFEMMNRGECNGGYSIRTTGGLIVNEDRYPAGVVRCRRLDQAPRRRTG